jgi:hypothetical protein
MAPILFGVGLYAFRRWLYKHPQAFATVETLFWLGCVLFVGLILTALLLQTVAGPPVAAR